MTAISSGLTGVCCTPIVGCVKRGRCLEKVPSVGLPVVRSDTKQERKSGAYVNIRSGFGEGDRRR
jgi:hypothetical protein